MAYLPAVLGTPLRALVLERLLRRGPATIGQLAQDLEASRQGVSVAVGELGLLGVVREEAGVDRRQRLVRVEEGHPFVEALRALGVDGAAWYETPETWQGLLARRYGRDWYVGGYAAIRRVLQPIDFESPAVLVNLVGGEEKMDLPALLGRAAGIRLRIRRVKSVPPEVVPLPREGGDVWFATPERGFVEAWRLKEVPLYGLLLSLVQGVHDGVLDPRRLLQVGPSEGMDGEVRALLAALDARRPLALGSLRSPRKLKAAEKKALDEAWNTVVG